MPEIKLTQTVEKGGCAAKVAASELRTILSGIDFPPTHPELLVDGRYFDDAAIYQIAPDRAMVQTLDFFTPILDEPYTFGRVAACNAVSDVYAMGGRPVTAMGILAFPLMSLDNSVIQRILQGASDLLREAKCTLVGGHSIDDATLKFGLSVTGFVDPKKMWTNTGAQTDDVLILTKGLGTGTLTAALKRSLVSETDIAEAVQSMGRLNNILEFLPSELAPHIHAATDVTGFGLSGHALQMARGSDRSFHFNTGDLPILERAQEYIEKEVLTKAHRTNREYTQNELVLPETCPAWMKTLIHDPQTSGGLLLSVSPGAAEDIVNALKGQFPKTSRVGSVSATQDKRLYFQ